MTFSKKQVDKAGDILRKTSDDEGSLSILSDWRSRHIYPLNQAFKLLQKNTKSIDNLATYGQRLKRISSILYKLERLPTIGLSRMQDIGGCRVILSSSSSLKGLYAKLKKNRAILPRHKDYLNLPKEDGYRGIHLIYQLKSKIAICNGLKIELQLRTKLQHAWATAVEIIDSFENEQLKLARGSKDWTRFFYLVADEFANIEQLPLSSDIKQPERISEIKELNNKLNALNKLSGYTIASNIVMDKKMDKVKKFILLKLDTKNRIIHYTPFKDEQQAQDQYINEEKLSMNNSYINILLVKESSIKQLLKSYPNYFADSEIFIYQLNMILQNQI